MEHALGGCVRRGSQVDKRRGVYRSDRLPNIGAKTGGEWRKYGRGLRAGAGEGTELVAKTGKMVVYGVRWKGEMEQGSSDADLRQAGMGWKAACKEWTGLDGLNDRSKDLPAVPRSW